MLVQFSLENYLSFKDEAVLSLVGNKTTKEHKSKNVTYHNEMKILKSAVVYGANASGKSNLFSGVGYMKTIVLNSFKEALSESSINHANRAFQLHPTTKNQSSFFEVVFILNSIQYRYGFEINKGEIEAEWLFYMSNKSETLLFEREGQDIVISSTIFTLC